MFRIKKLGKVVLAAALLLLVCVGSSESHETQAASTYQIKVNKQQNCVTIYKLDGGKYKPVKALICSTGWATQPGTYPLGQKMRWHTLDGPCYGQYCTRIYGGVLFHSVWYTSPNNPGTLSVSSYNKLGTTASHGCVRLTVAGAKWIYDNIPSGTPVIIYNSPDPGPLGKPAAIKLPYSVRWDPTDIWSSQNPWNHKKPKITGAKDQTVAYNTSFDVKKGVKAINTTGFDVTSRMKVEIRQGASTVSRVDTRQPGSYRVTYRVTDEIGRKASATVRIRVTGGKPEPKITGVEDIYVRSKDAMTKRRALRNVKVTQSGKNLAGKYIKVEFKKIKQNVYRIIYTAQNSSERARAVAKLYIDKVAPKIIGIQDGGVYTLPAGQEPNREYALSLVKEVNDNFSKLSVKDIQVKIEKTETGYLVTYSVKDQAGNWRRVTISLVPQPPQPTPTPAGPASGAAV